jgi:hypothetical protein
MRPFSVDRDGVFSFTEPEFGRGSFQSILAGR